MTALVPPIPMPVYLRGAAEAFPVFVHEPAVPGRGLGVVICPPFGWEEMSSYRPRRAWAEHLAAEGVVALRLDLPGSGDAGGGPRDGDRMAAWVDALRVSAAHLRARADVARVVVIGIGLGGMLGLRAMERGAAIDDAVLWAVPARGRSLLRQMTVFARMEEESRVDGGGADEPDPTVPEGALAVGGYLLNAQTCEDLRALDLRALELDRAGERRVLLLEQDGIRVDSALAERLAALGVAVTVKPARGFGKMLVEPQFAQAPVEVFAEVSSWLMALPASAGPAPAPASAPAVSDELLLADGPDGRAVREHFIVLPHPDGDMLGVVSAPMGERVEALGVLIGGTGHRIGPNRMWVELARRWARQGVATVRLDLTGVGDAGGERPPDVPALYRDVYGRQVRDALAMLQTQGFGGPAVSLALCAGAYWAVQASLASERPILPFMLNPGALVWDETGHATRMRRHYRQRLLRRSTWVGLFRGRVSLTNAPRAFLRGIRDAIVRRRSPSPDAGKPISAVFDRLHERGTPALVVFAGREATLDEFVAEGILQDLDRWPNLSVDVIPGEADVHTLRPLWLQRRVHDLLDVGLAHELQRLGLADVSRAPAQPADVRRIS
jgi:alpha/beta superfamily hydrolase